LDGAARAAQARDYAALLPASRSPGRELLAGALGASPPRISGGASLEPGADAPADAPAADSRQYGGAAVDAPLPKDIRQRALDEARERGFDYVVAGSIAMVRTEVSPTVTMAGAERATVRAELNSAFQLIYVKKGNVTKAGAADGRDALSVTMRSGRHLDDYQLVSALDKALRRAVNAAALRTAGVLAGRDLGVVSSELELEEERVYYQDSPGKRLRPEKPEK
jgi:hypothetical protein